MIEDGSTASIGNVAHLSMTPVKGTRMLEPSSVTIDEQGIVGDRGFLLVGEDDTLIEGARKTPFLQLVFTWDPDSDELTARLPDGSTVTGPASGVGPVVELDHFGIRTLPARQVSGPWNEVLSQHAGYPVRLLRIQDGHTGFDILPITLVSRASLNRVAQAAGGAWVDPRRLRGALVLEGVEPHEEEQWEGKVLVIGDTRLLVRTPVPRCVVTALDPESGKRDLNLPRAVVSYRQSVGVPDDLLPGYLGPPLAVYAEVLCGGTIELGMPFAIEEYDGPPRTLAASTRRDRGTDHPVDLRLEVGARRMGAEGVVVLDLVVPGGGELPAWTPGAHVEVRLDNGLVRHYSLCGDPEDRSRWRVGVLRDEGGRGGSTHVHESLHEGCLVDVCGPRNNFQLVPASRYVFIAGGIGITAVLPMVKAAQAAGAAWTLHYGGRSRQSMAFIPELETDLVGSIRVYPRDEGHRMDLDSILGQAEPATVVYCCGPEALLNAVERQCEHWPPGSLHSERFTPKALAAPVREEPFEVEFARSGVVVTVPTNKSIIDVADEAGVALLSSCLEGTCGTCETRVLEGEVDHRDSLLTAEEQGEQHLMFPCVSRAVGHRLVLDL